MKLYDLNAKDSAEATIISQKVATFIGQSCLDKSLSSKEDRVTSGSFYKSVLHQVEHLSEYIWRIEKFTLTITWIELAKHYQDFPLHAPVHVCNYLFIESCEGTLSGGA